MVFKIKSLAHKHLLDFMKISFVTHGNVLTYVEGAGNDQQPSRLCLKAVRHLVKTGMALWFLFPMVTIICFISLKFSLGRILDHSSSPVGERLSRLCGSVQRCDKCIAIKFT